MVNVLQLVVENFNSQRCDRVIIAGQLDQIGVFEIRMPSHDELRHVVEYEFSKHVPLPMIDDEHIFFERLYCF